MNRCCGPAAKKFAAGKVETSSAALASEREASSAQFPQNERGMRRGCAEDLFCRRACLRDCPDPTSASAETILGAMSKAYMNNSSLNSARAGVRVTDENVAIAKSGWRPTIVGSASIDFRARTQQRHDAPDHREFRRPDQPEHLRRVSRPTTSPLPNCR